MGHPTLNYTPFALPQEEWVRLVIAVKLGTSFTTYLVKADGTVVSFAHATVLGNDPEYALEPPQVILFGDGDGQNNAAEESAGTNPLDATSVLKATAIAISGNDVNITVATVSGKTYQLETSTTLAPLSWTSVGAPITATGPSTVFPHTGGAVDPKRFYRARVVP